MDAIRKAFEEWAAPKHFDLKRSLLNSEGYFDIETEMAWEGFEAAIDLILEPDWSNAPEWMSYHAFDKDGSMYFFSHKPTCTDTSWRITDVDKSEYKYLVSDNHPFWRESLRQRPKPPKKEWWEDISKEKPMLMFISGKTICKFDSPFHGKPIDCRPLTDAELENYKRGF